MIIATMPDRNNTMTSEFMMLEGKTREEWLWYPPRRTRFSPQSFSRWSRLPTENKLQYFLRLTDLVLPAWKPGDWPEPLDVGVGHRLQDVVPPRCPTDVLILLHTHNKKWTKAAGFLLRQHINEASDWGCETMRQVHQPQSWQSRCTWSWKLQRLEICFWGTWVPRSNQDCHRLHFHSWTEGGKNEESFQVKHADFKPASSEWMMARQVGSYIIMVTSSHHYYLLGSILAATNRAPSCSCSTTW